MASPTAIPRNGRRVDGAYDLRSVPNIPSIDLVSMEWTIEKSGSIPGMGNDILVCSARLALRPT
jgi:hypothetical protein